MIWVSAIIAFIKAMLGIKGKDPIVEQARENEHVAEKQAAIVVDHTRPLAGDRLRDGTF